MKLQNLFLVFMLFTTWCFAEKSYADEKLVKYCSGSLSASNKEFIQNFKYQAKAKYQIRYNFVNYSDSASTLIFYNENENVKEIKIDGLGTKNELIKLKPLRNGEFLIKIRAGSTNKFISYDISILKEE